MIPLVLTGHVLAIAIWIHTAAKPTEKGGPRCARYIWPIQFGSYHDGSTGFFVATLCRTAFVLVVFAVAIMLFNIYSPSIYTAGCSDPLLSTTISGIDFTSHYQYCWVGLTCGVLICLSVYAGKLQQQDKQRTLQNIAAFRSVANPTL